MSPLGLERRDVDILSVPTAGGDCRLDVEILHRHLDLRVRPAARDDRQAGHGRHGLQ